MRPDDRLVVLAKSITTDLQQDIGRKLEGKFGLEQINWYVRYRLFRHLKRRS